jgi:hypothetical protein
MRKKVSGDRSQENHLSEPPGTGDSYTLRKKRQSRFPVGSGVSKDPWALPSRNPSEVALSLIPRLLPLIGIVQEDHAAFHELGFLRPVIVSRGFALCFLAITAHYSVILFTDKGCSLGV